MREPLCQRPDENIHLCRQSLYRVERLIDHHQLILIGIFPLKETYMHDLVGMIISSCRFIMPVSFTHFYHLLICILIG